MNSIKNDFTKMFGIKYPIIGAPMFLVSNENMVVEISEAGGIGTVPSLNYRPSSSFREAIDNIKKRTKKPIGVNLIVNKSNKRYLEDLKIALDLGVELIITSLGNPKHVITSAHSVGTKVFCDVTNLEHGLKVQDYGADGVIAVASGAGGHAGPISPLVLIPWLKSKLNIPIVAAGGIASGSTMAAALCLGASAVSIGTRFIASKESQVDSNYKTAILNATPEDIVMTKRVSGTPAAVINTEYVKKMGLELPWIIDLLKGHPLSKKYVVPIIHLLGMKQLEKAATGSSWKSVWSAGQSVGLIDDILSCKEIIDTITKDYFNAIENLPVYHQKKSI